MHYDTVNYNEDEKELELLEHAADEEDSDENLLVVKFYPSKTV